MKLCFGIVGLIILFHSFLLSEGLRILPTHLHPPKVETTAAAQHNGKSAFYASKTIEKERRKAQLSSGYDFQSLDRKIRSEHSRFALCLLKNAKHYAPRLKLTLTWEGSGDLKHVSLVPDAGLSVTQCMKATVKDWGLKPHPGMQPFSYQVTLVP